MKKHPRHIILPDNGTALLRLELAAAFENEGFRVSRVEPEVLSDPARLSQLEDLLADGPALVFSINCMGLSYIKPVLEAVRRHSGAIAAWFVDNPWNILAGVRDPRWKELLLFVTDASFIEPLKKAGASTVFHLPLATSPEIFQPSKVDAGKESALAPFVFVGRSAFPGKERFFSGQKVPPELEEESGAMLEAGLRPDLHWWEERLAVKAEEFWPGKKARLPALGAEEANLGWRNLCLEQAALAGHDFTGGVGLDIFGDAGWQASLPEYARLHPTVDYYTRLPPLYAQARYSVSLTSLQLPQGLNQRHFDVWAAGGCCLTDATPGLRIFPEDLVRQVSLSKPQEIAGLASVLEQGTLRRRIIEQWRSVILQEHTYTQRVETILRHTEEPVV